MIDLANETAGGKNQLLAQDWELTDNDGSGLNLTKSPLTLFSSLHLFPQSIFLYSTPDSIYTGKWSLTDNELLLYFNRLNTKVTMSVENLSSQKLKIYIKNGEKVRILFLLQMVWYIKTRKTTPGIRLITAGE